MLVPFLDAIKIFSLMNRSLDPEPELVNLRPSPGFIPPRWIPQLAAV